MFGRLEYYDGKTWRPLSGEVDWTDISGTKRVGKMTIRAGDMPEGTLIRYRFKPYTGNVEYKYYVVRNHRLVPAKTDELRETMEVKGVPVQVRGFVVEDKIKDILYYVVPTVGPCFTLEDVERHARRLSLEAGEVGGILEKIKPALLRLAELRPQWADAVLVEYNRDFGLSLFPLKAGRRGGWYMKNNWRRIKIPDEFKKAWEGVAEELDEAHVVVDGEAYVAVCDSWGAYTNCVKLVKI